MAVPAPAFGFVPLVHRYDDDFPLIGRCMCTNRRAVTRAVDIPGVPDVSFRTAKVNAVVTAAREMV